MITIFFGTAIISVLHDSESGDDTRNCFLLARPAGVDYEEYGCI